MKKTWILSAAVVAALAAPMAEASLTLPNPIEVSAGPLGKIGVQGVASGMAFWQDNPQGGAGTLGAKYAGATITNGSVIVQKSSGLLQFYAQAGVYSFPTLAATLTGANPTSTINDFGALPIAYLKIAPSSDYSIEIGKLPTLIGAEGGFTYQNINIERGLLWDMEPIVSRGIQFNASAGPLSASLSWNDGYYSNRYNVLSGLLTYTINSANTLAFYADGPLGKVRESAPNIAAYSAYGTVSQIYGLMYTYSSGPWTVEPYFQYMTTPKSARLRIDKSFDNYGGSLLVNYAVDSDISLAGRVEYLDVGGVPGEGLESVASSLTDLPDDSHAWSLTVTPTYQSGDFFARAELSYVTASTPAGTGFAGQNSLATNQVRGMVETGFLF
ncbi:porin [Acidithiobacillus sp. CV18-2]|uniref:Porin n=1 Tax=Igneacidithiobacillus copahuensis TaxID=2724909 RepID=A0AAE2YQ47_9PROT|nr:outer membrane beta-barrel protein [Igneacidithiobacillus copahuensis]MBU2755649.1 porin [Acidithiobacillus sp. CV18-3]MBU2758219.1 porin [Acidithiobacillus sp. BN09-2]MBU2777477.1 porin [Acidithiobacillus sp. CV18-2]MBU2795313.1 porin [Acidithiobacillus sp. VAN18-2]MBU2800401.1 porin [Acidithiobacillus sp. VAN18-4]UTV80255.1 porin [Acidithiobacillus sp. YTS05]